MRPATRSRAVEMAWIGAYLALILGPLLAVLIDPRPPGLGFRWDLSMALGLSAMAIMGVQFALTARFRRAAAPFGIDIIYYFHRFVAVLAFLLLLAHALVLRFDAPAALAPADPREAPWHMTAGRGAVVLFAIVIATSLWRKPLRLEYDAWRIVHTVLATLAFALTLAHVRGASYSIHLPVRRAYWVGLTAFWVLVLVYVRVVKPWWMVRRPYRVREVRPERGRVWTLVVAPEGHGGLTFQAGQFAWLTLGASPFRLEEHPFSIASSPARAPVLEFSIKELGDFSSTIKDVQPGTVAYLDGPYGVFTVDRYPSAAGFVFVAGGIGVAPILSMLRALADRGETRPLLLFYGNQRWERVAFREECDGLQQTLDLEVVHVLGEPPDGWRGEHGFVTGDVLERHLPSGFRELEYFVCGPNPMIRSVEQSLHRLGVRLRRVHSEIFDLA